MSEENKAKFKKVFSKILQINVEEISDTMQLETLASWDSFNALMLVAELENEFAVKFSVGEVTALRTLKDIKIVLDKNSILL